MQAVNSNRWTLIGIENRGTGGLHLVIGYKVEPYAGGHKVYLIESNTKENDYKVVHNVRV